MSCRGVSFLDWPRGSCVFLCYRPELAAGAWEGPLLSRYMMSDATKLFLLLSIQGKGGDLPLLGPLGPLHTGGIEIEAWALQDKILDAIMIDPFYRPHSWAGQVLHPGVVPAYFQVQFKERILRLQAERDLYIRNLSAQIDIYIALYDKLEMRRTGLGCAGTTWTSSSTNGLRIWESPEYQGLVLQAGLRARYQSTAMRPAPPIAAPNVTVPFSSTIIHTAHAPPTSCNGESRLCIFPSYYHPCVQCVHCYPLNHEAYFQLGSQKMPSICRGHCSGA